MRMTYEFQLVMKISSFVLFTLADITIASYLTGHNVKEVFFVLLSMSLPFMAMVLISQFSGDFLEVSKALFALAMMSIGGFALIEPFFSIFSGAGPIARVAIASAIAILGFWVLFFIVCTAAHLLTEFLKMRR